MRERIRHSYSSPTRNYAGGVKVCVVAMSAYLTPKLGLGFPVALRDVPANSAFPACVARVDGYDRKPGTLALVFHKGTKLAEAPIVQSFSLLLASLNAAADMPEVFQHNPHAVAFSSRNDGFGNAVVLVFLEPLLLAAHLAKAAFGGACTDTLQDCASFGVPRSVSFDSCAGILIAKAVGSDVDDAHIHPKHPVWRQKSRVIEIAHGTDIPFAANEHQIDFALTMPKQIGRAHV